MILLAIIIHICQCFFCCSKMYEELYHCQLCLEVVHQNHAFEHAIEFHQVKTRVMKCGFCGHYETGIELLQQHIVHKHQVYLTPFYLLVHNEVHVHPFVNFKYCSDCTFRCITNMELTAHFNSHH